jgi:glycosyltransferase involved in cell wall biosynthesis
MRILFVVHRAYPYNGGSEYNVKLISENLANIGYDVSVLTDVLNGDYGNVKVISDRNVIFTDVYDWIIVHGNDMPVQDFVLNNITNIKSKVLYWMIKPSDSQSAINGFKYATTVGWGTSYDYDYVIKYDCANKAKYIRYASDIENSLGCKFEKQFKYFCSSGGFSYHKGFDELAIIFTELNLKDTKLILTGYLGDCPTYNNNNIICLSINSRDEYLNILSNSDLYIMNSYNEGFGLVLLDSMINKIPWIARNIAGATDMVRYGDVYSSIDDLKQLLLNYKRDENKIESAYQHIVVERNITNMVKDFKIILN